MKKILCTIMILLLILPVFAYAETLSKVNDESSLLSDSEVDLLEQTAQSIAQEYDMDVVILTVDTIDGYEVLDYADQYYDSHGYGMGAQKSGILFILSMSERDWGIRTIGEAKIAVTDYEIDDIVDVIWDDLTSGHYYETFDLFLSCIEDEYYEYRFNQDTIPNDPNNSGNDVAADDETVDAKEILINFGIALLIGAVAGLIVLLILRYQMNTARAQSGARSYLLEGSFDLYRCHDIFLYSRTSRTRKAESSSSGGVRSSGGSRGGRSGKF